MFPEVSDRIAVKSVGLGAWYTRIGRPDVEGLAIVARPHRAALELSIASWLETVVVTAGFPGCVAAGGGYRVMFISAALGIIRQRR